MNPTFDAFLVSWPYDPWLVVALVASAAIYARGWNSLRRHDAERWPAWRLWSFLGGLTAIFLALASPLETFAGLLLLVHMLQHMLLLLVAPPLIWLSAPMLPMLRGLPKPLRSGLIAPVLRLPLVREAFTWLTHPLVAWPLFAATVWLWHTPRGYELALADPTWHVAEHVSFVGAALLFWYPVVSPFPSRPRWSRWIIVPYLILTDVQNTVLAAWLTFSSAPIYGYYESQPRVGGWSPLEDQHVAGVLMWVPGSIALLVPVLVIGLKLLLGERKAQAAGGATSRSLPVIGVGLPVIDLAASCASGARGSDPGWDLLRARGIGGLLRRKQTRVVLQSVMLGLAVLVILDGLLGPNVGPANLAGVAPWIHWRGLVMLGLLVGGNFFCMACPFTLPRKLAARWIPAGRNWPRVLRSKWLAVALVALFLWSYEAFSLWDSPWLTAWIAIGYFVAAFAIDAVFRDAAFCKYVCPIGQFNFVQSLVSPLEVRVRETEVCAGCHTKECIRGAATAPGCGLHLYQPRKLGNLDCTFCLDCVQACPHENVGVLIARPLENLTAIDTFRSGIGRLGKRYDVAALVVLLVFGAFANAGGMIAPVIAWQDAWRERLGNPPLIVMVSVYYLLAIVVAPLVLVGLAASVQNWSQTIARGTASVGTVQTAARYVYGLVPLGFGMWLAHHGFHFLTSYATIVPVAQRVSLDVGLASLGPPQWQHACCVGVPDWIVKFELLALDMGLLVSLAVGYRIAASDVGRGRRALLMVAPWALLLIALFAVGVWIVLEPMQMRGTLPLNGLPPNG
jgi:cytochrome c oxidase assembly factor CtaG